MSSKKLNLPLQLLLFLRFAQLACTTLTTYACCFYIGFYVYYRDQPAPYAEYFLLFTSLITALELFLTTSYTIHSFCKGGAETLRIKYRMFLITSGIMTLLNYHAYRWLRTVPYLTEYDEGNNNGIYYYNDSVEHGTCAINDMVIVAGGLNVFFTSLIILWALWGMWYEKHCSSLHGAIRLGDESVDDGPDAVLPFSNEKAAIITPDQDSEISALMSYVKTQKAISGEIREVL